MKLLITLIALLSLSAIAEDVNIGWKNGINPNATTNWQSIVYVNTNTGPNITNNIASAIIQWPKTNTTILNLPSGTKLYFAVFHYDLEDFSIPSNEVYYKTKINPPQQTTKLP